MRIENIRINNFRNYGSLDLKTGPSVNIFYGNNAQGKTNLIEAINVCASVTSHKQVKDRNLIKFGENEYRIDLRLKDDDGYESEMEIAYKEDKNGAKRSFFVDGLEIKKISDYLGLCNTVIFAPEDLNIVKGAPSLRRKFVNCLITKISPTYINLLGSFNKLLNQKNFYLKKADINNYDEQQLDYFDYSLADLSAEIIIMRYRFGKLLSETSAKHHEEISGGLEKLNIEYITLNGCIGLLEEFLNDGRNTDAFITQGLSGVNLDQIKGILSKHIYDKLLSVRKYDIEKGVSSIGINRDDFEISLNGISLKLYSSQGQQRSAALSLKLAELEIIRRFVSSTPILLLDDVFSELDAGRRVRLISAMKDAQIFITCTDKSYIGSEIKELTEDVSNTMYYHVENGQITPEIP